MAAAQAVIYCDDDSSSMAVTHTLTINSLIGCTCLSFMCVLRCCYDYRSSLSYCCMCSHSPIKRLLLPRCRLVSQQETTQGDESLVWFNRAGDKKLLDIVLCHNRFVSAVDGDCQSDHVLSRNHESMYSAG